MRFGPLLLASIVGCASGAAWGEERVKLDISIEQTQLIVQTLGRIGCATVEQLAVCKQATDLLGDIRRQVIEQGK